MRFPTTTPTGLTSMSPVGECRLMEAVEAVVGDSKAVAVGRRYAMCG
jgi:hypothetical protein